MSCPCWYPCRRTINFLSMKLRNSCSTGSLIVIARSSKRWTSIWQTVPTMQPSSSAPSAWKKPNVWIRIQIHLVRPLFLRRTRVASHLTEKASPISATKILRLVTARRIVSIMVWTIPIWWTNVRWCKQWPKKRNLLLAIPTSLLLTLIRKGTMVKRTTSQLLKRKSMPW